MVRQGFLENIFGQYDRIVHRRVRALSSALADCARSYRRRLGLRMTPLVVPRSRGLGDVTTR